ncbi:FAD-dependent oxidoreductase [bacterium]|nr:FAD-dependent oxidoreductase [bacterium]
MRLDQHPILSFDRGKPITFTFDGKPVNANEGESIAAALHAAGYKTLSHSLKLGRPRGFFCAIGKCSSCMMQVNGIPNVKTCMVLAEEGMDVRTQHGWGELKNKPSSRTYPRREMPLLETDVAVVGAGPAGLSAAIYASKFGAKVLVFEENTKVGGQLIKQTHMFFGSRDHHAGVRGIDIGDKLISQLGDNVEIMTETPVVGYYAPGELAVIRDHRLHRVRAKKIIVATGASENMLALPNNDLPGVYGAGAVQTLMNVYGVLPGKRMLMVGAGNIGVIVAYQALQAGVDVAAVVEALPVIGAYQVHASKLRRCGVPILTRHTIQTTWGDGQVEGATIVRLDDNWRQIPGTEQDIACDTICLSVGLKPTVEIFFQAGCSMAKIPELGGDIPIRNEFMETSVEGLYVAGDASSIEEASSAMLEGRLAGLDAVEKLKGSSDELQELKNHVKESLDELRAGPFGEKIRQGEKKLQEEASRL